MKFELKISFKVERSGKSALDKELIKLGLVELDEPEEDEDKPEPIAFGFAK